MPLSPKWQEKFDRVCERIATGESLVTICEDPNMPSYSAVTKWLREDDTGELISKYAQAREDQADYKHDEMIQVARAEPDVNRARLIVDTLKWQASKLKPKVYGDKQVIDLNHGVQDDDESVEARLRSMAGKLGMIVPEVLFIKPDATTDDE